MTMNGTDTLTHGQGCISAPVGEFMLDFKFSH